ncbi:hypothetical protein BCR44DRAFT_42908, partial [Catenaria anguillulae PL171]
MHSMDDLVEPILFLALRKLLPDAKTLPWRHGKVPSPILAILNAVHPDLTGRTTRWLLMHTWWISADVASALDSPTARMRILNNLLYLNRNPRTRRPIEADEAGLDRPAQLGDLQVLDWWMRSGLIRDPVRDLRRVPMAASAAGQVKVLDWWVAQTKDGVGPNRDEMACILVESSRQGQVDSLVWWLAHDARLASQDHVLDGACKESIVAAAGSGHLHVVEWWIKQLGSMALAVVLEVDDVVVQASANGHKHVLDFWWQAANGHRDSERPRSDVVATAIDLASGNGCIDVLEWWWHKHMGGDIQFQFHDPLAVALQRRNFEVWHWWTDPEKQLSLSGIITTHSLAIICDGPDSEALGAILKQVCTPRYCRRILFNSKATDALARHGHVAVLNWIVEQGFKFALSKHFADIASEHGHVDILDWWRKHGLKPRPGKAAARSPQYSALAMDRASANGHVAVLQWWINQTDLRRKWTKHSLRQAAFHGQKAVLEWWLFESGLEKKLDISASTMAASLTLSDKVDIDFIEWWDKVSGVQYVTCNNGTYCSVLAKDSYRKFRYWNRYPWRVSMSGHRLVSQYLLQYGRLVILKWYVEWDRNAGRDPPRQVCIQNALQLGSVSGRLGTNLWFVQNGLEQYQFR